MYGMFTYIYSLNYPNVDKYTLHWVLSVWDYWTWSLSFEIEPEACMVFGEVIILRTPTSKV